VLYLVDWTVISSHVERAAMSWHVERAAMSWHVERAAMASDGGDCRVEPIVPASTSNRLRGLPGRPVVMSR